MKNSNLWKLLSKLKSKELQDIQELLGYPLFNKKPSTLDLFQHLKKAMKNPNIPMSKESVYKIVFKQAKYDAPKLRYAMSDLMTIIKNYLIQSHIQEQASLSQLLLCQSLLDREAGNVFKKEWNTTSRLVKGSIMKGGLSHLYQSQLHEMHYDYTRQHARQGDMHLQEGSDGLTMFYLTQTLRQRCLMLSHQNVAVKEYEQVFFDEVLSFLRQSNMKNDFLIEIYYHSYHAAINPDDINHFHRLKELLDKYWEKIAADEIRDIYVLIINYCIKKINNGEKEFVNEVLQFYKKGLQRNLLIDKGWLSRFTYKNIATIGLVAQENNWVLGFLESYKKFLHPSERNITYQYNLAIYHFRLSSYEESLITLRNVEFKNDVFYNLDIRRMLLRIYYELGHYDSLQSLLESFTTYINRNKSLGYHRENYLNLIKIVKKIIHPNSRKPLVKEKLLHQIQETKALAERKWLLDVLAR